MYFIPVLSSIIKVSNSSSTFCQSKLRIFNTAFIFHTHKKLSNSLKTNLYFSEYLTAYKTLLIIYISFNLTSFWNYIYWPFYFIINHPKNKHWMYNQSLWVINNSAYEIGFWHTFLVSNKFWNKFIIDAVSKIMIFHFQSIKF